MSQKNTEISVSKTSLLTSKMEDFGHFAVYFCWNGSRCSFICDQLCVFSVVLPDLQSSCHPASVGCQGLVCCGWAFGQCGCQSGAYYGEGKADCVIGNRVAPQTSLKGRNLLTPEEAHWHHFMWRPQWSKVMYFWLFNTIIEPMGFFSLLVFTFENNYFSHNYLNVLNLLHMLWINC